MKKILIIKLGAIGDVMMAVPSFQALKEKYPDSRVTLLTGSWSRPIVDRNPFIDEIIEIDEKIFWKKRIFELIKLFARLRGKNFDAVYVMHWSNLFNLFVYLMGIQERAGFNRGGHGRFLTTKADYAEETRRKHVVQMYLDLVSPGMDMKRYPMKIYIEAAELERLVSVPGVNRVFTGNKCIVGIVPGGGVNPHRKVIAKRWPAGNYLQLIDRIMENKECFVALFGSETDRDVMEYLTERIRKRERLINCMDKFDLRTTAALLGRCRVVISNDTGLLHVAAGTGAATLGIFGPTMPYDKAPQGDRHTSIYKSLECSPCYARGRIQGCNDVKCMASITPEEVYLKAAKWIS